MEKIGIAFITYKRYENFLTQLKYLYKNKTSNMVLMAVKDKDIDFHEDFQYMLDYYINTNAFIAYNKNKALSTLFDAGCDHIFLIEDDVIIKDINVFNEYINTAKYFNIGHLNSHGIEGFNGKQYISQTIEYKISNELSSYIMCYYNAIGSFQYFSRDCIRKCGMFDERYINTLEHSEYILRCNKLGFTTGPGKYADIKNSSRYLKLLDDTSTIVYDDLYNTHFKLGLNILKDMYGNNPWIMQSNAVTKTLLNYRIKIKDLK